MSLLNEIQKIADDQAFSEGRWYSKNDRVENFKVYTGGDLSAHVRGGSKKPYFVTVGIQKNVLKDWTCSCPSFRSPCKHIVAVIFHFLENGESRPAAPEILREIKNIIYSGIEIFRDQAEKELRKQDPKTTFKNLKIDAYLAELRLLSYKLLHHVNVPLEYYTKTIEKYTTPCGNKEIDRMNVVHVFVSEYMEFKVKKENEKIGKLFREADQDRLGDILKKISSGIKVKTLVCRNKIEVSVLKLTVNHKSYYAGTLKAVFGLNILMQDGSKLAVTDAKNTLAEGVMSATTAVVDPLSDPEVKVFFRLAEIIKQSEIENTYADRFTGDQVFRSSNPGRIYLNDAFATRFLEFLREYSFVDWGAKPPIFRDEPIKVRFEVLQIEEEESWMITPLLEIPEEVQGRTIVSFVGDWVVCERLFYRFPGSLNDFNAIFNIFDLYTKSKAATPLIVRKKEIALFQRYILPVLRNCGRIELPANFPAVDDVALTPVIDVIYDNKAVEACLTFRYGKEELLTAPAFAEFRNEKGIEYKEKLSEARDPGREAEFTEIVKSELFPKLKEYDESGYVETGYYGYLRLSIFNFEKMIDFTLSKLPAFRTKHPDWIIRLSRKFAAFSDIKDLDLAPELYETDRIDWFEIGFHTDRVEKAQITELLKNIKKDSATFLQDKNGNLLRIDSKNNRKLAEMVDVFGIDFGKNGKASLSKYQLAGLSGFLDSKDRFLKISEYTDKFISNMAKQAKKIKFSGQIGKTLRPYQLEGVNFIYNTVSKGFNCVLADEMGLGKTLQALALLKQLKKEGQSAALVVCPASLVFNWIEECAKFVPEMKAIALSGIKSERHLILSGGNADIYVTSYAMFVSDKEIHDSKKYDTLILDEAQNIKNHAAKKTRYTKHLAVRNRIALTGTPLENRLEELWSIFDFLMPGYLRELKKFREKYIKEIQAGNTSRLELLRKQVRPFILQRKKAEVAKEIPKKSIQVIHCEMEQKQKALYISMRDRAVSDIEKVIKEKGFEKSRLHIFAVLTRLKQVCCHPELLPETDKAGFTGCSSAKTELFHELAEEVLEGNHRALVFSQFTSMLDILEQELKEKNIGYVRLDGTTRDRASVVKEFQEEDGPPFFLLSLKAGGTGLNLTAADTVIMYDMWWNPAVEQQAMDRTHRIGQKRPVSVYRLAVKGTIDDQILKLQSKKEKLLKDIMDEGNYSLAKLTETDIRELFI